MQFLGCIEGRRRKLKVCGVQVFVLQVRFDFLVILGKNCLYLIPIRVTSLRIPSIKSSIEMEMLSSLHKDGDRISIHGYLFCTAGGRGLECIQVDYDFS